ncbi:hypothetical protein FEM48_Zijuj08G0175300 [Ziziphus jujuba var. spinosa]|uniref:Uncharacterized protein n=1 Tax=Ziziphus jujuba var. spinosa TaxID=714518 RepID=A0A978V0F4_ZIZJJ|nr:hypothetical protein FEM48_Zijuj08G0175300 [Ziziphus jujuba var. spinosa]
MGKKEEQHMVKNGGMVLEELISTGNGRCNPIPNFSAKQLLEATNNFHSPSFTTRGEEKWFKAFVNNPCDMQGRLVDFVAKKPWNEIVDSTILEEEGVTTEKQQKKLLDFLNLGLKCTQDGCENRPMMIDVAKELVRIHSSTPAP